jgi:hypothetical protein
VSIMLSGRNATDRPITITTLESSPYIQKPFPEFDPTFRTFSINLIVGPEYGYTLQKVSYHVFFPWLSLRELRQIS